MLLKWLKREVMGWTPPLLAVNHTATLAQQMPSRGVHPISSLFNEYLIRRRLPNKWAFLPDQAASMLKRPWRRVRGLRMVISTSRPRLVRRRSRRSTE